MVGEGGRGSLLDAYYQSKEIPCHPTTVGKSADRRTNFFYVCLQTLEQDV